MGDEGPEDSVIGTEAQGDWRYLRLSPPGGRFDARALGAVLSALDAALADPGCARVALLPRGRDLCTGPDDDLPPPGPEDIAPPEGIALLEALCNRIAAAQKPVVAVMTGRCASAGLAMALAAQARVALPGAVIDLPELRLARLPAGSAALRLMWLVGEEAFAVLRAGRAVAVTDLPALAAPAQEGALVTALSQAAAAPSPARPERAGLWRALTAARAAVPPQLPPRRQHERDLLETLEAAILLPPEQALELALARAQDCATRPAARALAHLARAARRAPLFAAAQPPEGPLWALLPPALAARLVPPLLIAGQRIVIWQASDSALDATLEAIALALDEAQARGALSPAQQEGAWARLSGQTDARAIGVTLTTPALAPTLPASARPILWGAGTAAGGPVLRPGPVRVQGGLPRLVECIIAPGTPAPLVRLARDLVLALGATPLRVSGAGLVAPMLGTAQAAAAQLLAEGATPAELGLAPLPTEALFPAPPAAPGQPGRPLPFSPARLVVLALICEAMRLLEAGVVTRPSDLDLAMVRGAGYASDQGGPFCSADVTGPLVLRSQLRQAATLGALWQPPPLLDELIRNGWRFDELNA